MSLPRPQDGLRPSSFRSARTLCPFGGIPVEHKGGTIAPPDQRRSYN